VTEVPWYYYPDVLERYRKDTEKHQMTVLHNDGLYRHLLFKETGSSFYWFELITTPGQLTIRGDMGTFVFSRIEDMFEFFDGSYINVGYWEEKLVAQDRSGVKAYDQDLVRKLVREHFDDHADYYLSGTDPAGVWAEIEEQIFDDYVICDESEVRAGLDRFTHPSGYRFADVWEWDFRTYTTRYLWCCHAIQQGIKRYRAANEVKPVMQS
jgi:hypothetical protein